MAALPNVSERDKIDAVLRLPGLNFPECKRVIGNKHTPLLIALGAMSTDGARAGNQLAVIRRLSLLFKAVNFTQDDCDTLDFASDGFYGAAIHSIAVAKPDMAKHLTPETLRLVIDLYTQAFARSGWKVIKNPTKSPNGGDADKDAIKTATEILKPTEHVDDCIKLEQLVKQWMRARGTARQRSTTKPKSVFHLFEDVKVPQQKPNETLYTYLARLQNEFRKLQRSGEANAHVLSYVSDQRLQRIGQLSEENEGYESLLDKRLKLLDMKEDQIGEYEALLHQRRECIDRQYEELNEFRIRFNSMQQVIDQYGDMLDNHEDLVKAHTELNDNLTQATEMQAEIMRLEIDAASRQNEASHKLDEIAKGHNEFSHMQNELSQEVRRAIQMQDSVADRQDSVISRQSLIMTRQMVVMDNVREMLNRYHQG